MKTLLKKQEFMDLMAMELPEGENKQVLMVTAQKLVPSEFQQSQLAAIHNCRSIQRASAAYRALNPQTGQQTLPIETLVAWLVDVGSVTYATSLEKRLTAINKIIWKYGFINPSAEYILTGEELIALRVHASIDPKLMW